MPKRMKVKTFVTTCRFDLNLNLLFPTDYSFDSIVDISYYRIE